MRGTDISGGQVGVGGITMMPISNVTVRLGSLQLLRQSMCSAVAGKSVTTQGEEGA